MSEDRPISVHLLVREHEKRVRDLETAAAAHDLRLQNGIEAFTNLKNELKEDRRLLAERLGEITPKPASPLRVASIVLGIVTFAGGALWSLSTELAQKEDRFETNTLLQRHEAEGHRAIDEQIRALREDQLELRGLIKAQNEKLDRLLERAPKR